MRAILGLVLLLSSSSAFASAFNCIVLALSYSPPHHADELTSLQWSEVQEVNLRCSEHLYSRNFLGQLKYREFVAQFENTYKQRCPKLGEGKVSDWALMRVWNCESGIYVEMIKSGRFPQ